jgi:hypothetical protein
MQSWNHIKLDVKKIWERTFHMCSKRARVRAHFSPTMIGLVKYQCTSSSQCHHFELASPVISFQTIDYSTPIKIFQTLLAYDEFQKTP